MSPDVFHEAIVLRMAYTDLVHHVCVAGTDPDDVALSTVLEGLDEFGVHRFGGLLFAYKNVETVEEGLRLAVEVETLLRSGERPRPLKRLLSAEDRQAVDEAFRRRTAALPWWKRFGERVRRALVADDEESRRYDEREQAARMREGRLP